MRRRRACHRLIIGAGPLAEVLQTRRGRSRGAGTYFLGGAADALEDGAGGGGFAPAGMGMTMVEIGIEPSVVRDIRLAPFRRLL